MPTVIISENTTGDYAGTDTGVLDTWIRLYYPTTNYGTSTVFQAHRGEAIDWDMALIKFDLSSIPLGSTITGVVLGIYVTTITLSATIGTRRLLRDWVESEATWNIYSTGNSWATAGGLSNGNDRVTDTSDTCAISSDSIWATWDAAGMVTDVQDWLDGTYSNYGWHLDRTDGQNDFHYTQFRSSDGTDGTRPYLSVTYTAAGGANIQEYTTYFTNMRRRNKMHTDDSDLF